MGFGKSLERTRDSAASLSWRIRQKASSQKLSAAQLSKPVKEELFINKVEESGAAEATSKPALPERDASFGTEASIKVVYEGKESTKAYIHWEDHPPKQLSKAAARAQDRSAFKAYKTIDKEKPCISGHHALKYHRLDILNKSLVEALAPLLEKEGVHLDVNETAVFFCPFQALWFCQEDILNHYKDLSETDPVRSYFHVLLHTMEEIFDEMRTKRCHMQASGLIDFQSLWTLFPRGSTVYAFGMMAGSLGKVSDVDSLSKVVGTQYEAEKNVKWLLVKAKSISYNGENFVWREQELVIPFFEGNKPVQELTCYPLEFHPEAAEVQRRLIARGKKMLDFQELTYCCYKGIAVCQKPQIQRHHVDGRVLIDPAGFNKFFMAQGKRENDDPSVKRNILGEVKTQAARAASAKDDTQTWMENFEEYLRSNVGQSSLVSPRNACGGKKLQTEPDELVPLSENHKNLPSEEDQGFMTGMLGGFALQNKLWLLFSIEDIQPMVWNHDAFSHLVYDEEHKDLVLSFVENHKLSRRLTEHDTLTAWSSVDAFTSSSSSSPGMPLEDVIRGKGEGLIILLSGSPGTGKTLMAEAVADRTRRPLFSLQAENLGIGPAELANNLKRAFEMATEWNAVVLLNEADVYMAARGHSDIIRNELVSIFLRELEYFRGIIFLTTNLLVNIDVAFRSRVSLHLLFKQLGRDARGAIWRNFLKRLRRPLPVTSGDVEGKEHVLDDDDVSQLSLWHLNGREIKNVVKMVSSWCDAKGYMMTLERMEIGIRVTTPEARKETLEGDDDLYD